LRQLSQQEYVWSGQNRAVAKAYATVLHLRKLAGSLVADSAQDVLTEYNIALIYYALNLQRFYSLPMIQREHALLSASLLADRIGQKVAT
jgi:hypothetical protein